VTDRSLHQKWNTRNEWWQIAQIQLMSNIYHEASRSGLPRGFGTRVKHGGMLSCAEVRSIAAGEDLDAFSPDLDHPGRALCDRGP
jgi:hypothetical protein